MLTRPFITTNGQRLGLSRMMATATKGKEVLPLKGVKVLDMTRVLAGVSILVFLFSLMFLSVEVDGVLVGA